MIKYIPLNQNIFKSAISEIDQENCLLLLPTRRSKIEALKLYQQNWNLSVQNFLTMDEWKESIFISDKPILKEEKRTLLLYQSLTKEHKVFFKITSYHKFIDFAHNFFNFWQEISEEQIDPPKIEDLLYAKQTAGNWQLDSFYKLCELKSNYKNCLRKLNFEDNLFCRDWTNFIKSDFAKIIIVNQFYFTNLEKSLLKIYHDKTIILTQIPESCFKAESLTIKDFSAENLLPVLKNKLKLYTSSDQTQMITQFGIVLMNLKNAAVIDFQFTKQPYSHLLSPEVFSQSHFLEFPQTRFYRFFKIFSEIINSIIWEENSFLLSLKSILNLISADDILQYFIKENNKRETFRKNIFHLIEQEYKFIDLEMIELRQPDCLFCFKQLHNLIQKYREIKSLKQFIEFLQKQFDLNFLFEDYKKSSNLVEVFFEALADFSSIEETKIVEDWRKIFPQKLPENLLKLFLDYLKPKKIRMEACSVRSQYEFTTLHDTRNLQFENLLILNVVEGILPDRKHNQFLLSENQRKELGLKTYEDITLRDKFYFFRLLCNAENTFAFTRINLEENVEISSFLEELRIHDLIEEKEIFCFTELHQKLFQNLLADKNPILPPKSLLTENFYSFPFVQDDFPQNKVELSFYKWEKLQRNPFEFYLEFICKLKKHNVEIEEDFSTKLIGTIAHEIITLVWKRLIEVYNSRKFNHNFVNNTKLYVQQAIDHYLQFNRDFKYISPHNFSNRYFYKVFLPLLADGIQNFFYRLHNDLQLSEQEIEVFPESERSEKKRFSQIDDFEIYLKGRPDLRIHSQNSNYIFDFKTGSFNSQKTKKYEKQLQFYEHISYPLDVPAIVEKLNSYLFYVEQKDLQKLSKRIDLKQEIEDTLKHVIENGYNLAEKADKYEDNDITRRDLIKK